MKSLLKTIQGRALPVTILAVLALTIGGALLASLSPGLMRAAAAAVTNYPPGVPVYALPINIAGPHTATATPVRFKLPYAGRLIGFSASAATVSGTITVDFQAAGSTLLSAPVTLTAATVTEATVTTSAVADEAELTVVLTISGGSPTVSGITVLPTFLRR